MSKPYLVTTQEREQATLAFCESDEAYIQIADADTHIEEGCVITWLKQEIA